MDPRFRPLWGTQRAHLFRLRQHGSPRQVKFGQPGQGEDLGRILRQALVTQLGVGELPLDHAEEVFHSAADQGQLVVELLVSRGQLLLAFELQSHARNKPAFPVARMRRLST